MLGAAVLVLGGNGSESDGGCPREYVSSSASVGLADGASVLGAAVLIEAASVLGAAVLVLGGNGSESDGGCPREYVSSSASVGLADGASVLGAAVLIERPWKP